MNCSNIMVYSQVTHLHSVVIIPLFILYTQGLFNTKEGFLAKTGSNNRVSNLAQVIHLYRLQNVSLNLSFIWRFSVVSFIQSVHYERTLVL